MKTSQSSSHGQVVRLIVAGLVACLLLMIAGCNNTPVKDDGTVLKPAEPGDTSPTTTPVVETVTPPATTPLITPPTTPNTPAATATIPPPPGIDANLLTPRTGDAQKRALMTFEEIIAAIPKPEYAREKPVVKPDAVKPKDDQLDNNVPLAAQRAYAAGRDAWRNGRLFEATHQFEMTLRLSPQSPAVHRMLAKTDTIKAAYYLNRTLTLDPTDLESAITLGLYQLEHHQWQEAISAFAHTLTLQGTAVDDDPTLWRLLHFYLSEALDQSGYDAAGILEAGKFLTTAGNQGRPLTYQLLMVERQRSSRWQSVGDALLRLNDPAKANEAYEQAARFPHSTQEQQALTARRVYVQLLIGKTENAQNMAVKAVVDANADQASLALASYVTKQTSNPAAGVTQLTDLYVHMKRPSPLAILIADLKDTEPGIAFLREHLKTNPGDLMILAHLFQKRITADHPLDQTQATDLLQLSGAAVTALPNNADKVATILFDAARNDTLLITAITSNNERLAASPSIRFLLARLNLRARHPALAQKNFEQVVREAPELRTARLDLVTMLISQREFDQAQKNLEPLAGVAEPDVVRLRARVLGALGKPQDALALLDEAIERESDDVPLLVEKALVLLNQNDNDSNILAERTLLDALNAYPEAEPIYELLFAIYDDKTRVPDADQQAARLMWRVQRAIPESRIALLRGAADNMIRRNFPQAEKKLRTLLEKSERDYAASALLLDLFIRTNRKPEAEKLIDEQLAKMPDDPDILQTALIYFIARLNEPAKAHERGLFVKALEMELPNGDFYASLLGSSLSQEKDAAKLDEQFAQYIQRFPQHGATLLFHQAVAYTKRGDEQRYEKLLAQVLEQNPDHPAANNALGYTWTCQDKNLEKAQTMIEKALESDPESAAYVDSLGWNQYKQGKFDKAVESLQRAQLIDMREVQERTRNARSLGLSLTLRPDSTILDHKGDALYRMDREAEALQSWRQAANYMTGQPVDTSDPEHATLAQRLQNKIEAVGKHEAVPVTSVPGIKMPAPKPKPPAPPAAAPAAPPAAQPDLPAPRARPMGGEGNEGIMLK